MGHSLRLAMTALALSLPAAGLSHAEAMYTNPVGGEIRMGDPFALFHEGRYYLYGTTAGDGFKGWTSPDLVNWNPLGYAYRRADASWGVGSFWAPEVAHYRGRCYMVFSCQGADRKAGMRLGLAVADDPAGPFADAHVPWLDNGWSCIDADLFVDEDGTPYLYFDKVGVTNAPSQHMYGMIYAVKLTEDLSAAATAPVLCAKADQPWEAPDPKFHSRCNEGAFVFKHDGRYYMTYSAGHYASVKYAIGWATAPSPLGPWTKSPHNPLLATDDHVGVSGPGHSCMVKSPDGREWFIVYHAHADAAHPGGGRTVNIDRVTFDAEGNLGVAGPTRTPQPYPSGAPAPATP